MNVKRLRITENRALLLFFSIFFIIVAVTTISFISREKIAETLHEGEAARFLGRFINIEEGRPLNYYTEKVNAWFLKSIIIWIYFLLAFALYRVKSQEIFKKTNFFNPALIYISLFLLTLAIRFPYFFYSVISWDEGTYIIMGQDILKGHLPYIHLWQIKPPLTFFSYAFFLLAFGKSVVAVRIAGLLLVFISASIIWKIGRRLFNEAAGFFAAVILIIFSSTLPHAQATMTEHLALLPISLALLFLLTKGHTNRNIFIIGFLLGIAFLIRLNLGYLAVMTGLVLFFADRKESALDRAKKLAIFALGFISLYLVFLSVYSARGELNLFIASTITAPLAYTTHLYKSLFSKALYAAIAIIRASFMKDFFLWLSFITGAYILFSKTKGHKERRHIFIIMLLFLSCLLSIVQTGRNYHHYYIQLIPFMALFGGIYLPFTSSLRDKWRRWALLIILLVGFFSPLAPVAGEYGSLFRRIDQGESFFNDTGYSIARHLKRYDVSDKYIFIASPHHIAYWLTGAKIPTKIVHPSDLNKAPLLKAAYGQEMTPESELRNILKKKPLFIIKSDEIEYFDKKCKAILNREIRGKYALDRKIDSVSIYKRAR